MDPIHFPHHRPCGRSAAPAACVALLALALLGGEAQAQSIVSVGPVGDAACSFNDLNAAINSVDPGQSVVVRLVHAGEGFEATGPITVFDRHVSLLGGFRRCADSQPEAGLRSVVRRTGANGSAIGLFEGGSRARREHLFRRLDITGGKAVRGGGIALSGNNHLLLDDVRIHGNEASESGGGIHVAQGVGSLRIQGGSRIHNNQSRAYGGGISCRSNTRLEFATMEVEHNVAGAHGGGIHLDGCGVILLPGVLSLSMNRVEASLAAGPEVFDAGGLASGGGLYMHSSIFESFQAGSSLLVNGNTVVHRSILGGGVDHGLGGGIRIGGDSTFTVPNLHLVNNLAREGGGAYLSGDGTFTVEAIAGACPADTRFEGCASLVGNMAVGVAEDQGSCRLLGGRGGALSLHEDFKVRLSGLVVADNQAVASVPACGNPSPNLPALGRAFRLANGSELLLANSLLHRHASNGPLSTVNIAHRARFTASQSTLSSNSNSSPVIRSSAGQAASPPRLRLENSILDQFPGPLYGNADGSPSRVETHCSLVTTLADFDAATERSIGTTLVGDPGFVDRLGYRLREDSPVIDRCAAAALAPAGPDLAGVDRPQLASLRFGSPFDMGAFEHESDLDVSDYGISQLSAPRYPVPGAESALQLQVQRLSGSAREEVIVQLQVPAGVQVPGLPISTSDWHCVDAGNAGSPTLSCRYAPALGPGQQSQVLDLPLRLPDEPRVLLYEAVLLDPVGVVDSDPTNNLAEVRQESGSDGDLGLELDMAPAGELRAGTLQVFGIRIRNHGPTVALRPVVEFELPADAEAVLHGAEGPDPSTPWLCDPVSRNFAGRQFARCRIPHLPSDVTHIAQVTFIVPAEAAGPWRMVARIQSPSDPSTPGRQSNIVVVQREVVSSPLRLGIDPPAVVRAGERQIYPIRIGNIGTVATQPLDLFLDWFEGAEFIDVPMAAPRLDGLPDGVECELPVTAKGGGDGGFACRLSPGLAAGSELALHFSAVPAVLSGPRLRLSARVKAGLDAAEVLVDSSVEGASEPPPPGGPERVFGNGFE